MRDTVTQIKELWRSTDKIEGQVCLLFCHMFRGEDYLLGDYATGDDFIANNQIWNLDSMLSREYKRR